jgi:hypothetical protein
MKGCSLIFCCLLAAANANASDARLQKAAVSPSVASPRIQAAVFVSPATARPSTSLADFGGGVVEMGAASSLMPEHATTSQTNDTWLTALAAFGLIALQLRRKHKSLPQRRIAPYA